MVLTMLSSCAVVPNMQTVSYVDLDRFMGDWHVIASVPTLLDRHAIDPIEHYARNSDGTIQTTYSYRKKPSNSTPPSDSSTNKSSASIAPRTEKTAKGYVLDHQSNAVWGMQFVWPIKADYRVVYLDEDYEYTIIARNKKDYAWVMSRNPNISKQKRQELLDFVASLGYQIEDFSIHH